MRARAAEFGLQGPLILEQRLEILNMEEHEGAQESKPEAAQDPVIGSTSM